MGKLCVTSLVVWAKGLLMIVSLTLPERSAFAQTAPAERMLRRLAGGLEENGHPCKGVDADIMAGNRKSASGAFLIPEHCRNQVTLLVEQVDAAVGEGSGAVLQLLAEQFRRNCREERTKSADKQGDIEVKPPCLSAVRTLLFALQDPGAVEKNKCVEAQTVKLVVEIAQPKPLALTLDPTIRYPQPGNQEPPGGLPVVFDLRAKMKPVNLPASEVKLTITDRRESEKGPPEPKALRDLNYDLSAPSRRTLTRPATECRDSTTNREKAIGCLEHWPHALKASEWLIDAIKLDGERPDRQLALLESLVGRMDFKPVCERWGLLADYKAITDSKDRFCSIASPPANAADRSPGAIKPAQPPRVESNGGTTMTPTDRAEQK